MTTIRRGIKVVDIRVLLREMELPRPVPHEVRWRVAQRLKHAYATLDGKGIQRDAVVHPQFKKAPRVITAEGPVMLHPTETYVKDDIMKIVKKLVYELDPLMWGVLAA